MTAVAAAFSIAAALGVVTVAGLAWALPRVMRLVDEAICAGHDDLDRLR